MDLDEIKERIIETLLYICIVLAVILPIVIYLNAKGQRDYELEIEKYKIEMKYKNGDVIEEN